MSEEQDYVIVTLGGDSDYDNGDDFLSEDSETECIEDTDDVLPLQPDFQSDSDDSQSDNYQPPSQMPNGVEDLAGLGDQLVPQMNYPENLEIYNHDSAGVEFIPLHNEGTSSVTKQDKVGLQDLIEDTNKQVTQLCGIISNMKDNKEKQSSLNRASSVVPTAGEPGRANTTEMIEYHRMGPDIASSPVHTPHDIEMQKIAENIQENNLEAMNCLTIPKIDNAQCSSFIHHPPGFVGDPKRNVTIPRMHLVIAQRKPQPKHAARYLVRNLFPREVLICSTANTQLPNSSGRQPLDPNIMAALREYLITIFPNHDLRECGRDWRACISYVNALIRYLCNAAKKNTKTVPTKRSTPASVDLDIKSEDDADEGSSQLPRQAAAPEISASGNSQPNISAVFEEFEEPSASASLSRYRTLCYIGNPNRNVQVTFLVLTIARKKACPQMAASYLLSQLFSEEVLLNSIIYGSLWPGVCALSSNRINAIREFLQDNYPACDLSEGGREWKMCVNSMNQHIHTLKPGHGNFPFQPSSSSNTSSSSSKSESDTDLSDQNT
uniref:BEN domain-containing protein n=1 Tax=Pipistrellus kuhlii TaxID=59472 RepID=A0A7J7V613_PIPKU|nr:hypothetical protein mPipKuh1_008550 [Pipistrellus kuhlii]